MMFENSDLNAINLQTLSDLSTGVAEMSLDVKDFKAELGQTSVLVRELRSGQEGKNILLYFCYPSYAKPINAHIELDQKMSNIYGWLSPLYNDFNSKQFDTFNTASRQDRLGRWVLGTDQYND